MTLTSQTRKWRLPEGLSKQQLRDSKPDCVAPNAGVFGDTEGAQHPLGCLRTGRQAPGLGGRGFPYTGQ